VAEISCFIASQVQEGAGDPAASHVEEQIGGRHGEERGRWPMVLSKGSPRRRSSAAAIRANELHHGLTHPPRRGADCLQLTLGEEEGRRLVVLTKRAPRRRSSSDGIQASELHHGRENK
jgi:hypothetical protein